MSAALKITSALLDSARRDLKRAHPHAHERVAFVTAGCARLTDGTLLLLARAYHPIADEDYVRNSHVGAMIGPGAMRKGLQIAYQTRSALLHIHTHGGRGTPSFSSVDLNDGHRFVPSFFNAVPSMPHGLIVLSDDSARCLLWESPKQRPTYANQVLAVGAPLKRIGGFQ